MCPQVSRDPVTTEWRIECSACGDEGAYRARASSGPGGEASMPNPSLADQPPVDSSLPVPPSPLLIPAPQLTRRNFLDRLQAQLEQAKIGGLSSAKSAQTGPTDDSDSDATDEDGDDVGTLSPLAATDAPAGNVHPVAWFNRIVLSLTLR
jgi:hypothetical protein